MTYIWEVLLKADEQGFPREKLRFTQAAMPSPYREVAFDEMNRQHVDEEPIEVNAYYRLSGIFDHVLDGLTKYPELKECLYDILMHSIAEINLKEGMCRNEYYGLFICEDVKSGKLGRQFQKVFDVFEPNEVRFVTESMVRLYKLGSSVTLFRSVMRQLYPKSLIYLDSVQRKELLIYVGKKETPHLKTQMEFLLSLFMPFDYVIHLFWDSHFGIIGVDETMELDEFVIY